jgi:threonine dehydrogenase-like Zn-dependent dehydrogenase
VNDIVTTLIQITNGRGPDVCIDAVGLEADGSFMQTLTGLKLKIQAGAATGTMWAIQSVRKGGNVVIIGVYGPPFNLIPLGTIMNKGITIRANQCNVKRYMPHLLEHIRAGRVDAKGIITHRVPLEEIAEGYHLFASKLDGCIKTVVVPKAA